MSKILTIEQIQDILGRGQFYELVGSIETEWMDCKAEPYHRLFSESDKRELSKDVASFANTEGGVILLGVKTRQNSIHFGDEVESINPFPQDLINPQQFYDTLQEWLYPMPHHLSVKWVPHSEETNKGIIAIEVPPQSQELKPFLIRKVLDSGKTVEIMFGYPERRRDFTEIWSVEKMQSHLRDGLHYNDLIREQYETIQIRLERLEDLQKTGTAEVISPNSEELLHQRIENAILECHLNENNRPVFVLAAFPKQVISIPNLFKSRNEQVVMLLENPPELRRSGFDIDTGGQPKIIRGELRRASADRHKSLELWIDGTLIFVARGDSDFLCWGSATRNSGRPVINQLAMIESTYLFIELSKQIYNYVSDDFSEIIYHLALRNVSKEGQVIGLIPGPINTFDWKFGDNARSAPATDSHFTTESNKTTATGIIAHQLLSKVYNWFSIETNQLPYVEEVGNETAISAEEIKKAGQ